MNKTKFMNLFYPLFTHSDKMELDEEASVAEKDAQNAILDVGNTEEVVTTDNHGE